MASFGWGSDRDGFAVGAPWLMLKLGAIKEGTIYRAPHFPSDCLTRFKSKMRPEGTALEKLSRQDDFAGSTGGEHVDVGLRRVL